MSVIAFRTDGELEGKLERAAVKQKKTKTAVILEALELYLEKESAPKAKIAKRLRLADALKADMGIWEGPATASVNTGKQLGDVLLEKHRTRRV